MTTDALFKKEQWELEIRPCEHAKDKKINLERAQNLKSYLKTKKIQDRNIIIRDSSFPCSAEQNDRGMKLRLGLK